jgi:hypothetical protein
VACGWAQTAPVAARAEPLAGAVSGIVVDHPGSGYTLGPRVIIDPPSPAYRTFWSNDGTASGEPAAAVSTTVSKGLYSVLLGQSPMVAIAPTVFTNPARASFPLCRTKTTLTARPSWA